MVERLSETQPAGWDAFAGVYDRYFVPFFAHFAADALRLAGVTQGMRLLDAATGPGTLALQAAQMGADVLATDYSPGMIALLHKHITDAGLTNIATEVMDGQALALRDDSFDAAFSMFALSFFLDRAAGFRELHRVLRPGGIAGVSTWLGTPMGWMFPQAVRRALPNRPAPPSPSDPLRDPTLFEHEMRAAGFAQATIHTATHVAEIPNAEAYWEVTTLSPVVGPFTEFETQAVHTALMDILHEEFGDRPVRYELQAHIGIGVK